MKLTTKPMTKLGAEGGTWIKKLIDASLKKDEKYFKFMINLRNLLKGDHWDNVRSTKKEKKQIRMVVNLAHAHVRTLVPTLFFQNPSVDCAPTSPQHAGKEKTWNGIINNVFDKTGFAKEMKKVVMDAVTYPEGVMKDVNMRVDEAGTTEASDTGPVPWGEKGSPAHVRIAPNQLIVDYLVPDRDVEKARYIAIRYRKPLAEVRAHPIYGPNVEKESYVTGGNTTTGNMMNATIRTEDDWDEAEKKIDGEIDEHLVTIYEVWVHRLIKENGDLIEQQMFTLIEDQEKPIRELTPWADVMGQGFNKFRVTRMVLQTVPDDLPTSELGVWEGMQHSLNWLTSRITELVENDRTIYEVDPTKIKNFEKFKTQFYEGRSRTLAEVTEQGAINMVQPSFVGRDNYQLGSMLQGYIQQVSGIGQNRRGGSGIRTATEASLVDQGTQIKTDEKVDIVSKFLIDVIFKTTIIIRGIISSGEGIEWVMRVNGDAGSISWNNFTKEDIDWLPEIRIRVDSFRKMDSMQDMQKYGALIGQAMQLFQMYGPTVRVDILFNRMLEAAGIYDAGKIVGDQDAQAMLQSVEISGILVGVPAPVLEEHNHAAHLQIIEAFRNSPMGQSIFQQAPEAADRLAQHEQEHREQLQISQEKAQRSAAAANPFAAAGQQANPSNQSIASQETSGDRQSVQPQQGGNGEFN